ncbi:MAG: NADP-dependent oxidoreductase [Novosphingobium sp.]|uniref:NADP-dependent oxidoreductase n=1 Tax=Novosphingobium sp. TaxID=1874826 RepID=UPI00301A5D8B
MTVQARQIVLARRPQGAPRIDDFALGTAALAAPAAGEVLVRNLWLSLDPYVRLALSEQPGLHGTVPLGDPLPGMAVGEVIASASAELPAGSFVLSRVHGWRDHYLAPAAELQPLSTAAGPIERYLGLYGLTGITAWGGIYGVLKPQPGETLFVNAAAGAVGMVAVQLAKRAGARVIASAGSDAKCSWVTGTLGADHAINYRREDLATCLAELAPEGLAAAFDNVGGEQLEVMIDAMAPRGRIALCGAIALYDGENYRAGPCNLFAAVEKHVSLTGFNAGFYFPQAPQIIADLAAAEAEGALVHEETIIEGLEAMPQSFIDLLSGASRGKLLIRV